MFLQLLDDASDNSKAQFIKDSQKKNIIIIITFHQLSFIIINSHQISLVIINHPILYCIHQSLLFCSPGIICLELAAEARHRSPTSLRQRLPRSWTRHRKQVKTDETMGQMANMDKTWIKNDDPNGKKWIRNDPNGKAYGKNMEKWKDQLMIYCWFAAGTKAGSGVANVVLPDWRRLSLTLPPFATTRGAAWCSMAQHLCWGRLSRLTGFPSTSCGEPKQRSLGETLPAVSWCVPCAKKSCWAEKMKCMMNLIKMPSRIVNCIIFRLFAYGPKWCRTDILTRTYIRVGIIMCNLMHMFSLSLSLSPSLFLFLCIYVYTNLSLSLSLSFSLSLFFHVPTLSLHGWQTDRQTHTHRDTMKKKNIYMFVFLSSFKIYIYISILIGTVYVYVIYVLMYLYTYPPCMPNTVQAGCQGCSGQAPTSRWDAGVMAVWLTDPLSYFIPLVGWTPFADCFGLNSEGFTSSLVRITENHGDTHNGIIEINPQMNNIAQMGFSRFFC